MTTCGDWIGWDISDIQVDWDLKGPKVNEDRVIIQINATLLNSNNYGYERPIILKIRTASMGEYIIEAPEKLLSGVVKELKKWSHHPDRSKYKNVLPTEC